MSCLPVWRTSIENVLMLRTMQGLTWDEIADRVGVNWRTAMRRHDRAVETLKRILDKRG